MNIFKSFKARVTVVLVGMMLTLSFVGNVLIYEYALKSHFQQMRSQLMVLAQLAAAQLDAADIAVLPLNKDSASDERYLSVRKVLGRIAEVVPSVTYIYILRATKRPGILQFVMDLGNDPEHEKKEARPGDEYDARPFPAIRTAFFRPSADEALTADKWGVSLSAYAPICDAENRTVAILGIDISAADVYAARNEVRRRVLLLLAISVLVSVALAIIVAGGVSEPVRRLLEGTRQIAQGSLDYEVRVKGCGEIAELAASFNKMSRDLKQHIIDLKRTTSENERFVREIEIAKHIQESFLPDKTPTIAELDIAVMSHPARIVGGDFYDFIPIDSTKWGFAVADVSGKGIPAALFMALSRTLLRMNAIGRASAMEAVERANKFILEDSKAAMFVTLFYAVLDIATMQLCYTNAGHNPPICLRHDEDAVTYLCSQGVPMGLMPNARMGENTIKLCKGDVVVLYTDGVTEAVNEKGERFELERLSDIAARYKTLSSADTLHKIGDALDSFVGRMPQYDDITLMVIKVV